MVKCVECGKEVAGRDVVYCSSCGLPLCPTCGAVGLCSNCQELWEAEEDLEALEE